MKKLIVLSLACLSVGAQTNAFADDNSPPPYNHYSMKPVQDVPYGMHNSGPYFKVLLGVNKLDTRTIANNSTGIYSGSALTKTTESQGRMTYGAGLGYDFSTYFPVRLELQFLGGEKLDYSSPNLFTDNNPAISFNSTVRNQTAFLNFYYDFDYFRRFSPYIGVGAGFARNKAESNAAQAAAVYYGSQAKTSFAWNGGLGINFYITHQITLDLGYNFFDLGKAEWSVPNYGIVLDSSNIRASEIHLGLSFGFWDSPSSQ